MASAKDLTVKPIAARDANRIIRALHYSGKVVPNSQVHLGVFLDGQCGGVMQFGPPLDKRKMQGLVTGTLWNEFLELNRMAFADRLPRNSESRCLGYAMRWLRKTYPHLQWVVSFADGAQCGDGTIYRASGFLLTGIKENNQMWRPPDTAPHAGRQQPVISRTTMTKGRHIFATGAASMRAFRDAGWRPIPGFQLRYLYFLDPSARDRLTVPILPFSEIARRGAGMYRGRPRAESAAGGTPPIQGGGGGSTPTSALPHQQSEMRPVGEA